jgi:hypothetical protein
MLHLYTYLFHLTYDIFYHCILLLFYSIKVLLLRTYFYMGGDPLTMVYFDNLDNGFFNKYEKNLKNRKMSIDMFFYV